MAKKQDFMSKTMKSKREKTCPVCDNPLAHIKVVRTEKSDKTDAWRFNQSHVAVCKCNENEIYK